MADAWIDVGTLMPRLNAFFAESRAEMSRFGSTVNQTFEAFRSRSDGILVSGSARMESRDRQPG